MGDAHPEGEAHLVSREDHRAVLVALKDGHLAANGEAQVGQPAVGTTPATNRHNAHTLAFRGEEERKCSNASTKSIHLPVSLPYPSPPLIPPLMSLR